ncbi:MAG TPA: hypothetical protein VD713_01040 [Sphingomonadales bacterium]|nr:hypothetical protein [Sphingomonadales bacterium]
MIKRNLIAASIAVIAAAMLASPATASVDCVKEMKAVDATAKKATLSKEESAKVKELQKKARAEIKAKKKECETTVAEAKKILKMK